MIQIHKLREKSRFDHIIANSNFYTTAHPKQTHETDDKLRKTFAVHITKA